MHIMYIKSVFIETGWNVAVLVLRRVKHILVITELIITILFDRVINCMYIIICDWGRRYSQVRFPAIQRHWTAENLTFPLELTNKTVKILP